MHRILAATLLFTAACQPHIRIATPPPELLSCTPLPDAPVLPGKDMQDARDLLTLDYILGIRSAYADCAGKLAGVARWADRVE